MTPHQFLTMHAQASAEFEGRPSPVASKPVPARAGGRQPEPREQKKRHMKVYRDRRKAGLEPLAKPWDYLCSLEVKDMAWQAYRVASWSLREDLAGDGWLSHQELRQAFATTLAEMFEAALLAHAVHEGGCWPVDQDTPPYRDYVRVWQSLSGDVPKTWRPEYPLYADLLQGSPAKEVDPATMASRPGSVIEVDEGNSDAHDSRP